MPEGDCGLVLEERFCREDKVTCPNPFLVLRGSKTFPV
jgi:hypothetical protein